MVPKDRLPYGNSVVDDLVMPGKRLGPYRVQRLVQLTLLGPLYHVTDESHGQDLCLQVLPAFFNADQELFAKLQQTVRTLQQASVKGILRPSHVERIEGKAAIVFEGTSALSATDYVLHKGGPIAETKVLDILQRTASILEQANANGIRHRSMAPENVLIQESGEVLIVGFGMLDVLDRALLDQFISTAIIPIQETSARAYFTLMEAMAPELRSRSAVDVRAEIYSLGLLGAFLLVGNKSSNLLSSLQKEHPDLYKKWSYWLEHSLHEVPEKRYQTFAALQKHLAMLRNQGKITLEVSQDRTKRYSIYCAVIALTAVAMLYFGWRWANQPLQQIVDEPTDGDAIIRTLEENQHGLLRVEAMPGARLYVVLPDDTQQFIDTIPEEGFLLIRDRLLADSYHLRVTAQGYKDFNAENITLQANRWVQLPVKLVPLPASLKITSEPAGIPVYINGKHRGETPTVVDNLPPGEQLSVIIRDERFRSPEEKLTLGPGANSALDFGNLLQRRAQLNLHIEIPLAELIADRLELIRLSIGQRTFEAVSSFRAALLPGSHRIRIEHPDFKTLDTRIELRDDETLDLSLILVPLPAVLELSLPENMAATVLVNNQVVKLVRNTIQLTPGVRTEIAVQPEDHLAMVYSIIPRPNQQLQWTVPILPIPGPESGNSWTVPGLNLRMAWIPSGEFLLGSPMQEIMRLPNEGPPN
ncbi:MAG: PEGA domain-containing protein [Verrucomicrobia bacterium]|nr:PEGA domain-containing protein [Verrucomicrobiota bacterium]